LLSTSFQAQAIEPIRIEIGGSYDGYSNEELRRRVWQLERAVNQLQDQVFQMATRDGGRRERTKDWSCRLQSFGKTHVSSGNTKASALAQVLKKCSDASNAVHCSESEAKCDNE
jgi:hypothetical protein